MSTDVPLRILISGDVDGKIDQICKRAIKANEKNGPFDLMFCVGSFLGQGDYYKMHWQRVKNNELRFPFPVYILGPTAAEEISFFPDTEGGTLADNIYYLGHHGFFRNLCGLDIAYVSGIPGNNSSEYEFSQKDIDAMIDVEEPMEFPGIDILLTTVWPAHVSRYDAGPRPEYINPSTSLSILVSKIRPRYVFSGYQNVLYERHPFRNHTVLRESPRHTTRFVALAKVSNKFKRKYLYALNMIPMKQMDKVILMKQPDDVTENPFKNQVTSDNRWIEPSESQSVRLKTEIKTEIVDDSHQQSTQQFFYNQQTIDEANRRKPAASKREANFIGQPDRKDQIAAKMPKPQPKTPCWFCLASARVAKHLVTSVGVHNYLALPKGPLVPHHVLILPIAHSQSYVACTEEVMKEIERYKEAISKCFSEKLNQTTLFFERNWKTSHLQIQCIPIPPKIVPFLQDAFYQKCITEGMNIHEVPPETDLCSITRPGFPYFYVELPNGVKLYSRIPRNGMDTQLAREILAQPKLLNVPKRRDWKDCAGTQEEEEKCVQEFCKLFESYDFTW